MKKLFNHLFWDIDISNLDFVKHKDYIISRVLEYGDILDLEFLFSKYSKDDIIKVLKTSKTISEKSGNFFYLILELKEPSENFECLRKPYTQKQNRF